MSWMDVTMSNIIKVTKCNSKLFEHIESMSKWPIGSVYIGNIIFYLT